MATPAPLPPITVLPASTPDFYTIAELEGRAFEHDELCVVAYGPSRHSHANLLHREKTLGSQPKEKGARNVVTKAVFVREDGKEELVGAAGWSFHLGREMEVEDGKADEETGEKKDGEGKEKLENGTSGWGEGANVKLCEDVFLGAEKLIVRSTEGKDYAKLNTLVVSPEYQRRGIGKMLIEDGLKEADRLGLQAVLGASKEGLGLYKKLGFKEVEVMEIRLWEYEGGEGRGLETHAVMHRPTKKI
ncbi:acyl-CoA N-acyltransferase [Stipitochalara longipes BDJ]|nr:acyl-CoA N-acyltransferase [Stipitochalara longipes BDJ]